MTYGVVKCALGWACWRTYVGRPEEDRDRIDAMSMLGNCLFDANHHEEALTVQEAELSMERRLGTSERSILVVQSNLACSYERVGRLEEALRMRREVYSGRLKLLGEDHPRTLLAANNYAETLFDLQRFDEAKPMLRRMMPVARRVLGDNDEDTIRIRWNYAEALYKGDGATLDDLHEAVTTLEDAARISRRVLSNSETEGIEDALQDARAARRSFLRERSSLIALAADRIGSRHDRTNIVYRVMPFV